MMSESEASRYIDAFRRLTIARGIALAGLASGRWLDFVVVTGAATLAFATGRDYTEGEVNTVLCDWLAGPGAMLATDHVELRRALVDCRLLRRDDYGRRYGRGAIPQSWRDALAALSGIDLAAEATAARCADAQRRAQRKAQWERRIQAAAAGS